MIARGVRTPSAFTAWMAASRRSGSRVKVSGRTSTKTGEAPTRGMTSAVAAKVKLGTKTASPRPIPQAISGSARASVPLAQVMVTQRFIEQTWLQAQPPTQPALEQK